MNSEVKTVERSAVDKMLKPRSIAVIGASAREGSLGNMVMGKVAGFGFKGEVYPINPKTPEIMGYKVYKSVKDVPGEIDTAVLCIPGQFVIPVIEEMHEKGITSCIIISAGFKEIGPEGVKREKELVRLCSEYGIRVIGPNCFGIINGTDEVSLDCTFARNFCTRGNIGFVSQSGAVGAAVNEDLRRTKMGLSYFISLGNRIDFDENEALEFLADDENTKVIFMYLENFSDPVKFLETASKITRKKPILALKAGKSTHGAQAAASHTGQLAQSDTMVAALLKKAGVIRVNSVDDLIRAAKAMYSGVIPEKEELAVVTNAGGFGVLAIDKAEELELKLAKLSSETVKFLEENLPEEASCHNPVDVLGTGNDEHYGLALKGLLNDPNVGGVIYNFGPPVMQKADPIAERAVEHAGNCPEKPVLSIYMNRHRVMEPLKKAAHKIYVPQYDYPEDAVWAWSKLLDYKKIKNREEGTVSSFKADKKAVAAIMDRVKEEGRDRLDFDEGENVLKAYGIPVANSMIIKTEDDAKKAVSSMKKPFAIKPVWGGVTHKTEMKAVRLNLKTANEIMTAVNEISTSIEKNTGTPYTKGFVLQEMAAGKQEVILGAVSQDDGIHTVMFGLGGIFVELLKDVAFGIPPITDVEASDMMKSIKGWPLLKGFRGKAGVDVDTLKDVIMKISMLVSDFPQIKELDVNPFMAAEEVGKSVAVDVRIIL